MDRFFIEPAFIRAKSIRTTDSHLIHQMKHVLRLRPGDNCVFLDNSGFEFLSEITRLDEEEMTATVLEKRKNLAEPEIFVTLYQALPKKMELFEWVLQKGTEIGVSEFVPLVTERTERRGISKTERLARIIKEAAEQCERGKIPKLSEPLEFDRAMRHPSESAKIALHSRGDFPSLSEKLTKLKTLSQISLFVGPEGGFTENEINEAKKNNCSICSLGPRILRTETAGIAAASLIIL